MSNSKNNSKNNKSNFIYKLNAEELEPRFLAHIFKDNDSICKISDMVDSNHFSNKNHTNIYHAMKCLYQDGKYIDDITLVNKIQEQGYKINDEFVDYVKYICNGYGTITSSVKIITYADAILVKYKERKEREIVNDLTINIEEYIEKGELSQKIMEASTNASSLVVGKKDIKKIDIDINKTMSDLEDKINSTEEFKITGLPLFWHPSDKGFSKLDTMIDGVKDGELISIAADSKTGKSFFACINTVSLCRYIKKYLNNEKPVIYFSLEMPKQKLIDRLIFIIIKQDQDRKPEHKRLYFNSRFIKHPKLFFIENNLEINEKNKDIFKNLIKDAESEINSWNLIIDYVAEMSIEELTAKINKVKIQSKCDIGCVIVDYVGLIHNGDKDVNVNIFESYRVLRPFSKTINCPFVLYNQILKSDLKRENDYRPNAQSFPGGGKIKQDSDVGLFLYRYSAYEDVIEKEKYFDKKNTIEIIPSLIRDGENTGIITCLWDDGAGIKEKSNEVKIY
ncbi:MAG: hypothetical protein GQ557_01875 [Mycoplasmataceae bacterium]|nr:hypothetical protein [Mycoplasmataceae bacterium]